MKFVFKNESGSLNVATNWCVKIVSISTLFYITNYENGENPYDTKIMVEIESSKVYSAPKT